jgi:hypothetical protein
MEYLLEITQKITENKLFGFEEPMVPNLHIPGWFSKYLPHTYTENKHLLI